MKWFILGFLVGVLWNIWQGQGLINRWVGTWRKYPKILVGYIKGLARTEDSEGDNYNIYFSNKILFNEPPYSFGITHIQYKSKWGFLITWPLCFHAWYMANKGNWIPDNQGILKHTPGTEKGYVVRLGIGVWRASRLTYDVPTLRIGTSWD